MEVSEPVVTPFPLAWEEQHLASRAMARAIVKRCPSNMPVLGWLESPEGLKALEDLDLVLRRLGLR